jgi:hypothetical protein
MRPDLDQPTRGAPTFSEAANALTPGQNRAKCVKKAAKRRKKEPKTTCKNKLTAILTASWLFQFVK